MDGSSRGICNDQYLSLFPLRSSLNFIQILKMRPIYQLLPLAVLAVGQKIEVPQVPIGSTTLGQIPLLGFGTWNLDRSNATEAVSYAIQTGYRHIDGAAAYSNEDLVGKGIADGLKKTGLDRSDIWVTSKLWNDQ